MWCWKLWNIYARSFAIYFHHIAFGNTMMKSKRRKKKKKKWRRMLKREWKCQKTQSSWEIKSNLFWQAIKNTSRSLKFSQMSKSLSFPNRQLTSQSLVWCISSWENVVSTATAFCSNAIPISTSDLIFCRSLLRSCQTKTPKFVLYALKLSQICCARTTMDYWSLNLIF